MPVPVSRDDGPRYCGNHMHLLDGDDCAYPETQSSISKRYRVDSDNGDGKRNKKEKGKRIPCPIDPSHLIFESALQKHIAICPAAKHEQENASQVYYSKDVNRGGFGSLFMGSENGTTSEFKNSHHDLAIAVLGVFCHLFKPRRDEGESETKVLPIEQLKLLTEQDMYKYISEIDLSYSEENTPQIADDAIQSSGRLSEAIRRHRIKAGGPRHIHQIASILGHLRECGLLLDRASTNDTPIKSMNVVEMGAGRGMLGLVVAGAAASSSPSSKVQLHLVDRSGSRAKAETRIRNTAKEETNDVAEDKKMQSTCLKLDSVEVTRIKADLAHVHMPTALPFLSPSASTQNKSQQRSKTIVIAKHLCGSGTDLALKSLDNISESIDGCVMATCCHGLCNWSDYTGRDYMLDLFIGVGGLPSFGKQDFDVLKRWTSASVLEDRQDVSNDDSDRHHTNDCCDNHEKGNSLTAFTVVQELGLKCGGNGLGRACQRIIDYGRCEYMRRQLFYPPVASDDAVQSETYDVKLVHYVSRNVTPQNALLLACRTNKA